MQPDQSNEELARLDKEWQEAREKLLINGMAPGFSFIILLAKLGIPLLVALWSILIFAGVLGEFIALGLCIAACSGVSIFVRRRAQRYEAAEADYKRRRSLLGR